MSTQRNYRKQSLQVKASSHTSGVNNSPNVAARYRLLNLENINIGQVYLRHVDEILVQRKVKDAVVIEVLIDDKYKI